MQRDLPSQALASIGKKPFQGHPLDAAMVYGKASFNEGVESPRKLGPYSDHPMNAAWSQLEDEIERLCGVEYEHGVLLAAVKKVIAEDPNGYFAHIAKQALDECGEQT